MGNIDTNIFFFRKVKYDLIIETFEDDFSLYASLLGLFRLRARSWMTKPVYYNYTDNFLHFCIETHESQTCLTRAKTSSIMEKLLTSFGAQYGVKFLGKQSLIFGETDCSCVFFEESASQTRALSPVSTL